VGKRKGEGDDPAPHPFMVGVTYWAQDIWPRYRWARPAGPNG
jgi:hypothetical protein